MQNAYMKLTFKRRESFGTLAKKVWGAPLISSETKCRTKIQISQGLRVISARNWTQSCGNEA